MKDYIPPSDVARMFNYNGILNVRDITLSNRKTNPRITSSHVYEAPDHTFGLTVITIGPSGSILTPSLARQFETALEKQSQKPGIQNDFVREIKMSNGGKGFAFLAGVGSGGTGYSTVLTVPSKNRDIAVAVSFSSDMPLQKSNLTQRYFDMMMQKDQAGVLKMLADAVPRFDSLADKIEQNPITQKSAATVGTTTPKPSVAVKTSSNSPDAHRQNEVTKRSHLWVIALALAVAIVVAGLVWRLIRKKSRLD
ncbi:MAG TPA: hypothetical protein VIT91_07635 [Chthoniobacterales bacterium]